MDKTRIDWETSELVVVDRMMSAKTRDVLISGQFPNNSYDRRLITGELPASAVSYYSSNRPDRVACFERLYKHICNRF